LQTGSDSADSALLVAEVHASSSTAISWLVKKLFDHTVHSDSTPLKTEILSKHDAKFGSHITENTILTLQRPSG
jgi:hypothetical protein